MDLFVRKDNKLAVSLYEKLDYCVYRHILQYYSDSYDAYGMYEWVQKWCFRYEKSIPQRCGEENTYQAI